ncbi:MAG: polysaccharide biosynthesis tyrosine autokinase, partial [Alphaproteobacteria bacterium]
MRDLLMTLWRRKLVIMGTALIITGFAVLMVMQIVPLYIAEASLVIEPPQTNVIDIESVTPGLSTDWFTQETQAAILGSRVLAEKVVDRLGLVNDPAFNPALRTPEKSFVERLELSSLLPESWQTAISDEVVDPAKTVSALEQRRKLREQVTDAYLGQLSIEPSDSSRVIYVRVTSPDPKSAAKLANTAAQVYIDDQVASKSEQTELANAWLQDRAVELKNRVEASARSMETHRRKSGLADVNGSSLLSQQMSELNSQLISTRAVRAESEARYAQLQNLLEIEDGVASAAAVLQSPLIQNLRSQEAEVVRKIAEYKTQLRDAHPTMILARNELKDLSSKIESEVRKIVLNQGGELKIAQLRVTNLEGEIARLQTRIDSQTDAEITLAALETELEANGKLYDTILSRLKETGVQDASLVQADARIISYATVPAGPTFPRKRMIVSTAFIASTFLGILIVMLLEQLDSGFRSRDQIEAATGVTVLGMVPRLRSGWFGSAEPHDDILDRPNTVLGESFRTLRTALLLSNVDDPPRTVLVTSSVPGEGKSTTALSLARTAAKADQNCLIIDADLRHPSLHRAFGVENDIGLIDYLSTDTPLEEIIQIDFRSGAHYILAGQAVPHTTDLLGSVKMRALIAALREIYDLVVIDTPPVLALSDTLVLLRSVDKTVFLVQWEKTRRETVIAGLRQVLDAGAD